MVCRIYYFRILEIVEVFKILKCGGDFVTVQAHHILECTAYFRILETSTISKILKCGGILLAAQAHHILECTAYFRILETSTTWRIVLSPCFIQWQRKSFS